MKRNNSTKTAELRQKRDIPLTVPTDLARSATKDIAGAMNAILADVFALYLKTKNFHWHMSGPHFRDYHLLLDEHGDQLYAPTVSGSVTEDNQPLAAGLREAHNVCDEYRDVATASLIEVWIDETERRTWFLSEIKRGRQ